MKGLHRPCRIAATSGRFISCTSSRGRVPCAKSRAQFELFVPGRLALVQALRHDASSFRPRSGGKRHSPSRSTALTTAAGLGAARRLQQAAPCRAPTARPSRCGRRPQGCRTRSTRPGPRRACSAHLGAPLEPLEVTAASSSPAQTSPSRSSWWPGVAANAMMISGNQAVESAPLQICRRTRPASISASTVAAVL